MITNFELVKRSRQRSGKCVGCGNRTTRTVKVEHTINPLNKNEDGTVRTRAQVIACVAAELEQKCSEPLRCNKCEGA